MSKIVHLEDLGREVPQLTSPASPVEDTLPAFVPSSTPDAQPIISPLSSPPSSPNGAANGAAQAFSPPSQSTDAARVLELLQQVSDLNLRLTAAETERNKLRSQLEAYEVGQANQGVLAQFAEIARWREADTLSQWADRLVAFVVQAVQGLQATLYTIDFLTQRPRTLLYLSGYAHPADCPKEIAFGKGQTGQVALSQRPFSYRATSNGGVAFVQAGLFSVAANYGYIYPLVYNNRTEGVLEITAVRALGPNQLQLLKDLAERIGTHLATVRSQVRVEQLYREARDKTQELEQREQLLREKVEALNAAQAEMARTQQDLAKLNEELEARVTERTQRLELALGSLKNTQDQLVLSEKMAALGQLVAGVAHEINSPIGAIKASATTMQDLLPLTLEILPEILVQMSPEQRRLFAQLVASLRREDFAGTLSSREQRKHRKALEAQLEAAGVVANYEIASDLLGAGFQGDISPYISLFTSPEAMQISQCVYSLGQVRANLDNINLAVDRTKKVVFALKSYAYTRGDQDERVQLNLAESLETVLTIYHNQIKYGIIVDTHFEEVPIITAYADELSQVWTNLLQNAIQAMKGEGHLRVSLRSVENWVEIRITDNGPGIPVDIQEKIFQPFFTTKKQGEGTGLGLDICKRIVEKHGGTLSLESKPGETTFITRLPVTQPVL